MEQRNYRDVVRPVAAAVQPDGSIEVELYIPDQDEPIETTIHATPQSKRLADGEHRDIDLDDDGDIADAPFRRMILEVCADVQRQVDARREALAKTPTRA